MADFRFLGPRVKLQRANKFISELKSALNQFDNDDPFRARIDTTKNPPAVEISWKGLGPEVGAILGDAVHNLPTALDLMASELVKNNGKSEKDVYFPFSISQVDFSEMVRKRNFHRAGEDAVKLVETYAPYKGGNEKLRALHDLDIEDKHKSVLETEKTMNIEIVGSYEIDNVENHNLSVEGSSIKHHFAKDSALNGLPVVETLLELQEVVTKIVDDFENMANKRVN